MAFNVKRIVSAIAATYNQKAWQVMLIEERTANPDADAEKHLTEMLALIDARVVKGEIDEKSAGVNKSQCRTLMRCPLDVLIDAAAIGTGVNELCKRVRFAVTGGVKDPKKGGRPAGQGKGKTTAPTEGAAPAEAAAELPNGERQWKLILQTMQAQVPSRKDWASEDIVAFQDCASKMIALLQRNSK